MTNDLTVKQAIVALISERGPISWRGLEIRLRVPRENFRDGYTLMTYLDELVADGAIEKTVDGERYQRINGTDQVR